MNVPLAYGTESPATGVAPPPMASPPPPRSFDEVYEAYFAFVWRSVRRLGVFESAVDDAVQEVFLVVHRRLGNFEERASIKTWIYGIVLRVVRDHRRALRRKPAHLGGAGAVESAEGLVDVEEKGPHEGAARREATRTLHELLDALGQARREVFVLSELEQLTASEIAEILGSNVNTVYARLRAARREFEQALARHLAREGRRSR
jgi:RNA polymerase sigma-70 factor, ECF subfamily